MAKFKSTAQNLSFNIPDDGEIFRSENNPNNLYYRVGNKLYNISNANNTVSDFASYPVKNYNFGDLSSAFQQMGTSTANGLTAGNLSTLEQAKAKQIEQGEVISMSPSSTNIHSPVVSSNFTGEIINQSGGQADTGATFSDIQSAVASDTSGSGGTGVQSGVGGSSEGILDVKPPTSNLKPGDTGNEVKKLQDYLVSKGVMTQAQVDTGYGTYGPRTQQAVKALQESLGVDNTGGVGYFGPKTRAAVVSSPSGSGTAGGSSELDAILNNTNLTDDQKSAIESIYSAVEKGDADNAERVKAAMAAASEFSDPYFKAQIRLATDALTRGISGKEGDLAFAEGQQRAAIDELRANTAASKDQLSFEHAQELKNLETKYTTDLENTQQNLAATGFTQSTRRARSEQILSEQNEGLVESSNKTYGYQVGNLDRNLSANESSTQAQIANLQRLTSEGKLDIFRGAEEKVGSGNLPDLSGLTPLGGVGGSIPREKAKDQLSFANNFVF